MEDVAPALGWGCLGVYAKLAGESEPMSKERMMTKTVPLTLACLFIFLIPFIFSLYFIVLLYLP